MSYITGSWPDGWLFQFDWQRGLSHSVLINQSSVGEGAVEINQAFVVNSWDTFLWKRTSWLLLNPADVFSAITKLAR